VDLNCENAESHALEVRLFDFVASIEINPTQLVRWPAQYQDDARLIEPMLALALFDSTSHLR